MARRFSALMLLCLAALLTVSPAGSEPRAGTVAGLDLSSPVKGAESFARAWNDGDYFVAWLALDPELRFRFEDMLVTFNYASLHGGEAPAATIWDRYNEITVDSQRRGGPPGMLVDRFADFQGFMQAGREFGFPSLWLGRSAVPDAGAALFAGETLARVPISGGDGGVLVMRRSPGGLWRLLGIEGRDAAPFWAYVPE